MRDTLIGRQFVRSSRNLLIWNGLLFAALIVFFALTARYYYNFAFGPFPIGRDAVGNLRDANLQEYFVTVEGDICLETGINYTKTNRGRQSLAGRYLVLDMGDSSLVVKTGLNTPPSMSWVGTIETLPPDVSRNIAARNANAKRAKPLLPVMIDASSFRTPGVFGLVISIPLGLMAIRNLAKGVARLANPDRHPLAKTLLKFGEPTEVAEKIQTEYDSDDKLQVGPATLTRSWLIHPKTFGVDLVFLGDAVWTYKAITQHYHNGVPTGKSYAGNICDIHGTLLTVPLKSEVDCDEFVREVVARVPWVLPGFDQGLADLWKSNKPALYEIAEKRRKRLMEELRLQREAPPEGDPPIDEVEPA
jgi:hypothetical protein